MLICLLNREKEIHLFITKFYSQLPQNEPLSRQNTDSKSKNIYNNKWKGAEAHIFEQKKNKS